ncbi:hypothetical protein ACX27_01345 [Nostoc piscinale CENA21]|uniref:Uncharacterized protein n=1 Tax=Nostoc piscinale CENA21 TaxID=224013 RepID=A0A0M3V4E3_9NOSO|nr:hypothetical protein [Nostoc piscinale]ALF51797.1 hypothetical protein ACX27_01345 [Nostoc piscinale CENA21]
MNWKRFVATHITLLMTVNMFNIIGSDSALAASKKIPNGIVAQIFNDGLDVSEVFLNSYGKQHGNSWHEPNSSYINFYGFVYKFDIPEFRKRVLRRLYIYNVANLKSNKLQVKPLDKAFELEATFESKGSEIKGICRRKRLIRKGYRNCIIGQDKGAPDVNWENPNIRLQLVPISYKGGIALKAVDVQVGGEFQAAGICNIGIDICNSFTDYKGKIKKSIADAIMTHFNSDTVRQKMSDTSLKNLPGIINISNIKSVSMQNGFVEIEY